MPTATLSIVYESVLGWNVQDRQLVSSRSFSHFEDHASAAPRCRLDTQRFWHLRHGDVHRTTRVIPETSGADRTRTS